MEFREFYDSGQSRDGELRLEVLNACLSTVTEKKEDILSYLTLDLGALKPECLLIYCSLIERPLKIAAGAAETALRPSWEVPKAPYIISPGRTFHEPYGLVLIDPDRHMPYLHSFGVYLMSLAVGNCTVFRFRGRETSTAAFLTDLLNKCVPEGFGEIIFANEECRMTEPDLTIGGMDFSAASAGEKTGKAVAIFDATAELDKSAEKVIRAWKLGADLTAIAPEVIFVPNVLRDIFVRNFNKWHRRKSGMEAPEKLPVVGYKDNEDLQRIVRREKNPAALYIFSEDDVMKERLVNDIPFLTGCINGTSLRPPDLRAVKAGLLREKTLTIK